MRSSILTGVALLAAGHAHAATVSYAVVIGNNAPPSWATSGSLGELRYADDDAVRFYQLFEQLGAHVELLSVLDEETQRRYLDMADVAKTPTWTTLQAVMTSIRRRMQDDRDAGDEPVFYLTYSGHGAPTEEGRVALALTDIGLTQQMLYDQLLAPLSATYSHLLIDACYAGAVVGVRGSFDKEASARTVPVTEEEISESFRLSQHSNVGVLVASTSNQKAHEWSEIESGVFTHELLSALHGAADVNGDSRIEYSEVHAFVASANRDLKDPRARPHVVAHPPRINRRAPLVVLRSHPPLATLTGMGSDLGPFFIELENGQRYLDAHFDDDIDASVDLPPNAVAYLKTRDREARIETKRGKQTRAHDLVFRDRLARPRGSIEETYHADLFASAYGREYYKGFVDSTGSLAVQFEPVRARIDLPRTERSKAWSVGLLSGAGALAISSGVAGYLAWAAKRDFNNTTIQKDAHDASDRYFRYSLIAIAAAGVAIGLGAGGWLVWPTADVSPDAPGAGPKVGIGLSISMQP